jgi:glycosyltransferase 2 family protein
MKFQPIFYIKIAFAIVSLGVLFSLVPLAEVAAVLGDGSGWLFSLGLLLQFLCRAAATVRMRVVAVSQGIALSLLQLFRILLATQFYSLLLPGALAGGGAAWVKYLQHGAGRGAAAAVVVLNRAIGLGMTITLGSAAWAFDYCHDRPVLVAVAVLSAVTAIGILILLPPQKYAGASPPAQPGRVQPLSWLLHRLRLLRRISSPDKARIAASALLQEMLASVSIWIYAAAIGTDVSLLSVIWMRAALTVVLFLPVTVAGIGVREATLVGLGALVGISASAAVAWSFTILAGTVAVAATGGLIEAGAAGNLYKRRVRATGRDAGK